MKFFQAFALRPEKPDRGEKFARTAKGREEVLDDDNWRQMPCRLIRRKSPVFQPLIIPDHVKMVCNGN